MLDNSALVRIFIAGKLLSSSINTEENCWFNILALSGSATDSSPSVLSKGDTPSLLTRLLFTYFKNADESPACSMAHSLYR